MWDSFILAIYSPQYFNRTFWSILVSHNNRKWNKMKTNMQHLCFANFRFCKLHTCQKFNVNGLSAFVFYVFKLMFINSWIELKCMQINCLPLSFQLYIESNVRNLWTENFLDKSDYKSRIYGRQHAYTEDWKYSMETSNKLNSL